MASTYKNEIKDYYNEKLVTIINIIPKNSDQMIILNRSANDIFLNCGRNVYRVLIRIWIPLLMLLMIMNLEFQDRNAQNIDFYDKNLTKGESLQIYRDFHTPIVMRFEEIARQQYECVSDRKVWVTSIYEGYGLDNKKILVPSFSGEDLGMNDIMKKAKYFDYFYKRTAIEIIGLLYFNF